jgi:hypothetical protein
MQSACLHLAIRSAAALEERLLGVIGAKFGAKEQSVCRAPGQHLAVIHRQQLAAERATHACI